LSHWREILTLVKIKIAYINQSINQSINLKFL